MRRLNYMFAVMLLGVPVTGCSEPTPAPTSQNGGQAAPAAAGGTSDTSASTSGTTTAPNTAPAAGTTTTTAPPQLSDDEDARAAVASRNNLKSILIAMHNHHDTLKSFPAAYSMDPEGKPLLSWRVLLLPFLGHDQLFRQFHLDEPWDSEHNKTLISQIPPPYRSAKNTLPEGKTTYLTLRGPNTLFPPTADAERGKGQQTRGTPMRDIRDGTANTIAVVEVVDAHAVIWTAPEDFTYDASNPSQGLLGVYQHGFPVGLADGSVPFLTKATSPETLKAMFTSNGGEVVSDF